MPHLSLSFIKSLSLALFLKNRLSYIFTSRHINRHDLYAYKHYDNHQYSLIPGLNSSKSEPNPIMYVKKEKHYDVMDRLRKLGYSRDVRDVGFELHQSSIFIIIKIF